MGCVAELPGGVVARSESELSREMQALVGCPERRCQLSSEGWAASQETYDWERVINTYNNLLLRLADKEKGGGALARGLSMKPNGTCGS